MASSSSLSGTVSFELPLAISAQKLWDGMMQSHILLPKVFPEDFKSIHIDHGDGKTVGSVRTIVFAGAIPNITTVTEKVEFIDQAARVLTYSIVGGDMANFFKVHTVTNQLLSAGPDACNVKWSLVYEKVNAEVPDPQLVFVDKAKEGLQGFAAYLLAN